MASAEEGTAPAMHPQQTSTRRVARNSLLQAGADAIGKLGTIVLYAVLAREAGVAAFGDFTTATSLSILMMIAAFGMDFRITRLVARHEDGVAESFWSAIVLKLIIGVAILAALLGVAIVGPYDDRVVVTTLLLGLAILVELTLLTPHAVFRGLEQLRPVAIALIIYRGTLAAAGIVVLLLGGSIVAVAAGWLGSVLLAMAYTVSRLRRAGLHFPVHVTRDSLWAVGTDSFGLGLAGVFGAALTRLDVVLLGLMKDSEVVALYGSAYRLMESTQFLTAALSLAAFPALSRLSRTSAPTIAEATGFALKVVLIVTAPIAVFFLVYAEPLLKAVYGPDFGGGRGTLVLLAPVVVISGVTSLVSFILSSQSRARPITIAVLVGTLVNLPANLLLIPSHGAEGAAVAWILTSVVIGALLIVPTLRATGRIPVVRVLVGPLAAAGAMLGVGLALGRTAPSVPAAFAAFVVVLFAVERVLFPDDAARVVRTLRRRAGAG